MFKLNFEEKIKDITHTNILNTVSDFIVDDEDDILTDKKNVILDEQYDVVEGNSISYQDKYEPAIELLNNKPGDYTKEQKARGEHLFTTRSFFAILFFCITAVLTDFKVAYADKKITADEWIDLGIILTGSIITLIARGAEGSTGVYTSDWMPGLNKNDFSFIDENKDDRFQL